jgi:hypothetical protein
MSKDGTYRLREDARDGIAKLLASSDKSAEALAKAESILSRLGDSDWKGEAKDSFMILMELTIKYHKDLNEVLLSNFNELAALGNNQLDFLASSSLIAALENA